MSRKDLFESDVPPGHEDRVLHRVGPLLKENRLANRQTNQETNQQTNGLLRGRRSFAAFFLGAGSLVMASFGLLYLRNSTTDSQKGGPLDDLNFASFDFFDLDLDLDSDIVAELDWEQSDDSWMDDLELIEDESIEIV